MRQGPLQEYARVFRQIYSGPKKQRPLLVNADGRVIRQNNEYFFGCEPPGYSMEEIRDNPENLRQSRQDAARKGAENIIGKM